ncbi:hypothetical protein FSP39_022411 [Pinctada imbricata]|uniref:Carbohydrate kinase PfkB domain-containing protein n=1 Tax=Pinctada imbricata TaxID=66713 RepID=A0AA88XGN8_PINIB|nr:hypothetical protein FSP39_022411 [Pinctada imbricata]
MILFNKYLFCNHCSFYRALDMYWQKGGNAANSSSVLAMLGANSEYMGSFANDAEMRFLKDNFKSYNVNIEHCRTYESGHVTPTSVIVINSQNGSRTIMHASKKLPEVISDDFKKIDLSLYKWIHFEGRPNFNTDTYEIVNMLKVIDEYNKTVAMETRIVTSVELEKAYRPELDMLTDKADYIFVSKEYSQRQGYNTMKDAARGLVNQCRQGASIICPWGEKGATAMSKGGELCSSPSFPPEKVTDTLCAGDTFVAATVYGLSEGRSLQEAITYGCRVAGAKCGMTGIKGIKDLKFD